MFSLRYKQRLKTPLSTKHRERPFVNLEYRKLLDINRDIVSREISIDDRSESVVKT